MASDDIENSGNEEEKESGGKLKLILISIIFVLLILAGAAGGAYYLGYLDQFLISEDELAKQQNETQVQEITYMDLEEVLVSINSGDNKQKYLKLRLSLELSNQADQAAVTNALPRIKDRFQGFLRELRPEELQGSAAVYRIKEELLTRINTLIRPLKIREVLISDMVVQ